MPKLDLNFGEVGQIPPEGIYRLVVDDAWYHANKAKDGMVIEITSTILDSPDPKWDGFKPFPHQYLSFKKDALWKLQEGLEAITQDEWKTDDMELEVNDDDNRVPILMGKTYMGICKHTPGRSAGQVNFTVETFMPDDGTSTPSIAIRTDEVSSGI